MSQPQYPGQLPHYPGQFDQAGGWQNAQAPQPPYYGPPGGGPPPYYPPSPYQGRPPEPPRKPRFGLLARIGMIIGGLILLVAISRIGDNSNSTRSNASSARTPTVQAAPLAAAPATTEPPAPVGPLTTFSDGLYEVGRDVAAGSYRAPGGGNCYWARHTDASGEFEAIIANEWKPDQGQVIVTAQDGEFLEVSDCGTWTAR